MAYDFLKKHYLSSMTPEEKVFALLDKACSCLKQGRDAMVSKDYGAANTQLITAQEIFLELQNMLQIPDRPTLRAAELMELFIQRAFLANLSADPSAADELLDMANRLRIVYAAGLGRPL